MQKMSTTRVGSSFTSGAVSASVATLFTYPFDIMRTRLIYQADTKIYSHIFTGISTIVRKEGLGGLYKGFVPCLVSIVPYMGGCFYILEVLKEKCRVVITGLVVVGDTPGRNSLYGAVAGAVSKILVYPLDTGKKLLQVYRLSPQKDSMMVFLERHFQATGVRGLYAGVVTATLKSALSSSLLFGFFTLSKLWFHPSEEFCVCPTKRGKGLFRTDVLVTIAKLASSTDNVVSTSGVGRICC